MTGTAPLMLLSGAPGAGKSTLACPLADRLTGTVVYDMDALLERGQLLGVDVATGPAKDIWPAYNRLWTRIVHPILRAGVPVLLLCPLMPDELDAALPGGFDAPVHAAVLDCADDVRTRRLTVRDWSRRDIEATLADAAAARSAIPTTIRTDDAPVSVVVERVRDWTRRTATTAG